MTEIEKDYGIAYKTLSVYSKPICSAFVDYYCENVYISYNESGDLNTIELHMDYDSADEFLKSLELVDLYNILIDNEIREIYEEALRKHCEVISFYR